MSLFMMLISSLLWRFGTRRREVVGGKDERLLVGTFFYNTLFKTHKDATKRMGWTRKDGMEDGRVGYLEAY